MGTLTLTDPVNGTANDATLIANNNNATKTVVNGGLDATNLSDPGSAKVWGSSGAGSAAAVYPPGRELAYVENTTSTSVAVVTESSSSTVVVSSGSVAFDGSACWIEFFAPGVVFTTGAVGDSVVLNLWSDSSALGRGHLLNALVDPDAVTNNYFPASFKQKVSLAAGNHTINATAFKSTSTCSVSVLGGPGGSTQYIPAYIRITKA